MNSFFPSEYKVLEYWMTIMLWEAVKIYVTINEKPKWKKKRERYEKHSLEVSHIQEKRGEKNSNNKD